MAITVLFNEVKGKSMLAFSRNIDVQYKTAFILAHKLREAIAASRKALRIGVDGRRAFTQINGFAIQHDKNVQNILVEAISDWFAK